MIFYLFKNLPKVKIPAPPKHEYISSPCVKPYFKTPKARFLPQVDNHSQPTPSPKGLAPRCCAAVRAAVRRCLESSVGCMLTWSSGRVLEINHCALTFPCRKLFFSEIRKNHQKPPAAIETSQNPSRNLKKIIKIQLMQLKRPKSI